VVARPRSAAEGVDETSTSGKIGAFGAGRATAGPPWPGAERPAGTLCVRHFCRVSEFGEIMARYNRLETIVTCPASLLLSPLRASCGLRRPGRRAETRRESRPDRAKRSALRRAPGSLPRHPLRRGVAPPRSAVSQHDHISRLDVRSRVLKEAEVVADRVVKAVRRHWNETLAESQMSSRKGRKPSAVPQHPEDSTPLGAETRPDDLTAIVDRFSVAAIVAGIRPEVNHPPARARRRRAHRRSQLRSSRRFDRARSQRARQS
jgi:hypothetical protein